METHNSAAFRRELEKLFRGRTAWLRASVDAPRPAQPVSFNRGHVNKTIARLQDLASDALAERLARGEFLEGVRERRSWHPKRGKSRSVDDKRRSFNAWFDEHLGSGTFVYAFWNGRKCVYVGKTRRSGRRISAHFEKHWFGTVTRIDVYQTTGRRVLPALECLAIHWFQPARNKFRAERRKWTRKCELCSVHRDIDNELRWIFRLR